jgi:hypothetical protein
VRSEASEFRDQNVEPALGAAVVLLSKPFDAVVAEPEAFPIARQAMFLAKATFSGPCRSGTRVIGPDGAPLWRPSQPRLVGWFREHGFEPEAVRRVLARSVGRDLLHWDAATFDAANRDILLETDPAVRLDALAAALAGAGLEVECSRLPMVWETVEPRITRMGDVAVLLAFLRRDWQAPSMSERDLATLSDLAGVVIEERPASGEALTRLLEARAGARRDLLYEERRVLRWAITGQGVAPALARVWDLLGADGALSRLESDVSRATPRP